MHFEKFSKYIVLMAAFFFCGQAHGVSFNKFKKHSVPSRPILTIFGIDAGEWTIINYLRKQGQIPTLDKYIEEGAFGRLESFEPYFSPTIWTTIATGMTPLAHGIGGFKMINPSTGNTVPINRSMRKTQAIWNIFTKKGLNSLVVAWWATWPAEEIRGTMVSDYTWPLKNTGLSEHFIENKVGEEMKFQTFPRHLYNKVDKFFVDKYRDNDQFTQLFDTSATKAPYALKHSYAKDLTYFKIYQFLRKSIFYDFTALYLQGTDLVAHKVWPEFTQLLSNKLKPGSSAYLQAQFMVKYYKFVDKFLSFYERKLRRPNETVMIISDHGFEDKGKEVLTKVSDDKYEKKRYWHGKYGIIIAHGPKIKPRTKINGATVFDITPTVLAFYHLPLAKDMPGRPLTEILGDGQKMNLEKIASYEPSLKPAVKPKQRIGKGEGKIKESGYDKAILKTLNDLGYIQ